MSDPAILAALQKATVAACSAAFGPCTCEKPEDCVEGRAWMHTWPRVASATIAAFLCARATHHDAAGRHKLAQDARIFAAAVRKAGEAE